MKHDLTSVSHINTAYRDSRLASQYAESGAGPSTTDEYNSWSALMSSGRSDSYISTRSTVATAHPSPDLTMIVSPGDVLRAGWRLMLSLLSQVLEPLRMYCANLGSKNAIWVAISNYRTFPDFVSERWSQATGKTPELVN
jgi:hypothetical protein